MRLLVFGATGYLGSRLLPELRARGHHLRALVRTPAGRNALAAAGVETRDGDLLALDLEFDALLHGVDGVVFAPQLLVSEEHVVVSRLLDAMQGRDMTFVFTSGTGVLARRTDGWWDEESLAEDDAFVPLKPLALRAETERLVRRAGDRGVRGIVVRPPGIWGHGGANMLRPFFQSAARTGAVCYLGAGLNMYSHVHVDDLARLFGLAIERAPAGALYHAVAGEMSNRCIAEAVAARLGLSTRSVTFDEAAQIVGRFTAIIGWSVNSRTRCPRARAELGWAAERLDLREDIAHSAYAQLAAA